MRIDLIIYIFISLIIPFSVEASHQKLISGAAVIPVIIISIAFLAVLISAIPKRSRKSGYVYVKEEPLIKQHSEEYINKQSRKPGYVYKKSIQPKVKSAATSETQKTAGLFTGGTGEYAIGIIAASLIFNSILFYNNVASPGASMLTVFLLIALIVTWVGAILLIIARLRYLRLNTALLILSFIPIVQSVFGIVLIFLQPKSDTPTQPIKEPPPEKKTPAPSLKPSDKDEEIEDLEKQIKIAELKKKLKELEEE